MKKSLLRFMVALCFVFSVLSVGDSVGIPSNVKTVYAAPGDTDPNTPATPTDGNNEKITGNDNSTLNIKIDDNGNISGGIADQSGENGTDGTITTGNKILGTLSLVFTIVLAAAAIILAIVFVVHCVGLAKDGNNPQGKSASINGLIMTAVAAVLCGGVSVFMGMFFNVFR